MPGAPSSRIPSICFTDPAYGIESVYEGDKAVNRPADLGYWVGYKIAESYYKNAKDKKQAVKELLEIKDFSKFLADSRYEEKFN